MTDVRWRRFGGAGAGMGWSRCHWLLRTFIAGNARLKRVAPEWTRRAALLRLALHRPKDPEARPLGRPPSSHRWPEARLPLPDEGQR